MNACFGVRLYLSSVYEQPTFPPSASMNEAEEQDEDKRGCKRKWKRALKFTLLFLPFEPKHKSCCITSL